MTIVPPKEKVPGYGLVMGFMYIALAALAIFTRSSSEVPGIQPLTTPKASKPNRMSTESDHRRLITRTNVFYVLIVILTILFPASIHHKGECRTSRNPVHLICSFTQFMHQESYKFKVESTRNPGGSIFDSHGHFEGYLKEMGGGEIWEGFALIQAVLFSFVLIFDLSPEKFHKLLIFVMICMVPISLTALIALLFHSEGGEMTYQALLALSIVGFTLMDFILYRKTRDKELEESRIYRRLFCVVDVPILLVMILLYSYVGFPIADEHKEFFGGAIAFQLMLGNCIIFIVRNGLDTTINRTLRGAR